MKQIALDIGLAPEPTLAGFLAGRNAQAAQHVRLWAESAGPLALAASSAQPRRAW